MIEYICEKIIDEKITIDEAIETYNITNYEIDEYMKDLQEI